MQQSFLDENYDTCEAVKIFNLFLKQNFKQYHIDVIIEVYNTM